MQQGKKNQAKHGPNDVKLNVAQSSIDVSNAEANEPTIFSDVGIENSFLATDVYGRLSAVNKPLDCSRNIWVNKS